jgi:1,4-dihydroxy-2-naphthoate polyprenyltransferase
MTAAVLWKATRAYSLPASIVPVLLGTALATRGYGDLGRGEFHLLTFLLVLVGAVLAHFGANVINDYFDYIKGVDTRPEHGSGVLTQKLMTPQQALVFALLLFAGAGLCGLFLLARSPGVVVPLALVGLACAVLYSAVLKKFALGDLLIVIAFGLGLTLGAYGVQVGNVGSRQWLLVALLSVPICLLVDAILHANNLRDAADDRAARVRTFATILSPKAGQQLQRVLLFGPLAFVVVCVAAGLLPVWSLATLLSLPLLIGAARSGSVEGTAQTHLVFGVLYTIAFVLPPVLLWSR